MEVWILICALIGIIIEIFNLGVEGALTMTVLRILKVIFFIAVGIATVIVRITRKAYAVFAIAFKKIRENADAQKKITDEQRKITEYFLSKGDTEKKTPK